MKNKIKLNAEKIVWLIVFISLIISVMYSIISMILLSTGKEIAFIASKSTSEHLFTALKCFLGAVIMFVPAFLEKQFDLKLKNSIKVSFVLFLYGAIILGDARDYYYKFPYWDTILHIFSGALICLIGFSIIDIMIAKKIITIKLDSKFIPIFAFCFALSLGAIWEFYEFTLDRLLNLNMQRYLLSDGSAFIGALALLDTMEDLIVDALGAVIIIIFKFISVKRNKKITN
jgi:hypothetical protein